MLKISDQYSKDEADKRIEFLLKIDFDAIALNLQKHNITRGDIPFIKTPGSQYNCYKKSDKLRIINFRCDFINNTFKCEFTSVIYGKKCDWEYFITWNLGSDIKVAELILMNSNTCFMESFMKNTIFNLENSDMWAEAICFC